MTEPRPQPLQIHGVPDAVKHQFRVYSVAHDTTQADAFKHMFLTLLAIEHETEMLDRLQKLSIQIEA